jgi:hypothetical protein
MTVAELEKAQVEVLLRIEASVVSFETLPPPAEEFRGARHTALRRAAARLRSGQLAPPPNMSAEEIAREMENTIRWEVEGYRCACEILRTLNAFLEMIDEAENELFVDALAIYHEARRLAKEQGPESQVAEVARDMERAWRQSHPRVRPKRKGKRSARRREHSPFLTGPQLRLDDSTQRT